MTLARMTTARRQIISSASQSLGRNGPPATRPVAVRRRKASSDTPWMDFGTGPAGFPPEIAGIRAHMRSVRPGGDVSGPSGEVKLGPRQVRAWIVYGVAIEG